MDMNHLKIKRSKINGDGLYSTRLIKKGSRIGLIQGETVIVKKFTEKLSQQSLNWIGIGRYSWIDTKNSPFKFINHSCDPNAYILGKKTVVALKRVEPSDEVTMDYSLTEADEGWSIEQCSCGNTNCRNKIGPITTLSKKQFNKLKLIIPSNFQRIFQVENKG
jgi:SET domain-containing protein